MKLKYSTLQKKYKRGELEEKGTWEDFFKLDHLEAEKDSLKKALDLTTNFIVE